MLSEDFRRHPDGAIDFDFYRRRASRLRRQAMRQLFDRHKADRIPLLAATLVAAIVIAIGAIGGSGTPEATLAGEHQRPGGPT